MEPSSSNSTTNKHKSNNGNLFMDVLNKKMKMVDGIKELVTTEIICPKNVTYPTNSNYKIPRFVYVSDKTSEAHEKDDDITKQYTCYYLCTLCNILFMCNINALQHSKKEHCNLSIIIEILECIDCKNKFRSSSYFIKHICMSNITNFVKILYYYCIECKQFLSNYDSHTHVNNPNSLIIKPRYILQCPICFHIFACKKLFLRHTTTKLCTFIPNMDILNKIHNIDDIDDKLFNFLPSMKSSTKIVKDILEIKHINESILENTVNKYDKIIAEKSKQIKLLVEKYQDVKKLVNTPKVVTCEKKAVPCEKNVVICEKITPQNDVSIPSIIKNVINNTATFVSSETIELNDMNIEMLNNSSDEDIKFKSNLHESVFICENSIESTDSIPDMNDPFEDLNDVEETCKVKIENENSCDNSDIIKPEQVFLHSDIKIEEHQFDDDFSN